MHIIAYVSLFAYYACQICREFVRGSCRRHGDDCKFAHPGDEVERNPDNTVTICMEFLRKDGRTNACKHSRCKYFHPPRTLLDSLVSKRQQNRRSDDRRSPMPRYDEHRPASRLVCRFWASMALLCYRDGRSTFMVAQLIEEIKISKRRPNSST